MQSNADAAFSHIPKDEFFVGGFDCLIAKDMHI